MTWWFFVYFSYVNSSIILWRFSRKTWFWTAKEAACWTINSLKNLHFSLSDCSQLHAPLPTQNTLDKMERSLRTGDRLGPRAVQNFHLSRDGLHGGDCLPKPAHHQVEDRFESVRQRIQRLIETDGFREVNIFRQIKSISPNARRYVMGFWSVLWN